MVGEIHTSSLYVTKFSMNSVSLYQCKYPFSTQMFPGTLLPPNYADVENPDRLLGRSEVERRRDYIQTLHGQLGEQHPLVQVVHQCLHNTPSRRPSAAELLPRLDAVRAEIEGPYSSKLKKIDVAKVGMMKALREIGNLQEQMQQLEVGWLCVSSEIRDIDLAMI